MKTISRLAIMVFMAGMVLPTAYGQEIDPVDTLLACCSITDIETRLSRFDNAALTVASARQTGDLYVVSRDQIDAVENESFSLHLLNLTGLLLPFSNGLSTPRVHAAMELVDALGASAPSISKTTSTSQIETREAPENNQVLERDEHGIVDAVSMVIARTRSNSRNVTTFNMENGQIWKKADGLQVRIPRGDLSAIITRAALGSYRLRINSQGHMYRVRRSD